MTRIRYDLIAKAIDFYEGKGFKYVEVPWIVGRDAINVTLPDGKVPLETQDGTLVGSAEQAFIQLAMDDAIKPGRYVAASPCFRDDVPDRLHQRYFFKVELIAIARDVLPSMSVEEMAELARSFYATLPGGASCELAHVSAGIDLEIDGVELGSYGSRSHDGWRWTYGTGFAEPRFSIATTG